MSNEEKISDILSEYYLQNKQDICASRDKYDTYCEVYNDFTQKNNEEDILNGKGFFHYINLLNKMAKNRESYCGVDMADFANKMKECHSLKSPFNGDILDKDKKGRFVIKKKIAKYEGINIPSKIHGNNVVGCYELVPIGEELSSVFKAFVYKYLEFKLFPGVERINLIEKLELQEPTYSWDNIIFKDNYIVIKSSDFYLCNYTVLHSKSSFNNLIPHFKKIFENLEIRIRNNEPIFNDEKRFNEVLMSVNTDNSDDRVPDLIASPKPMVLRYFNSLSNDRMKEYVINLKQKFFSYLCLKQLDKYKIKYALERRVNYDSEADEVAFIFTINESADRIVVVFENVLENRSSIAFIIDPNQYDKAINSISGYFSSDEINKREYLSTNYVQFQNSGIKKMKRIIHNDYSQWQKDIDWLKFSWI
ncbi:MAG: hypothetical protein K6E52_00595 [Bacteroidaceae bacterium]|nr:hypothetical protein [Bacteroidaceae bacterium]